MFIQISDHMRREVEHAVFAALSRSRIINVREIAEDIQTRNWEHNVAIEDWEEQVLHAASRLGAGIVFETALSG